LLRLRDGQLELGTHGRWEATPIRASFFFPGADGPDRIDRTLAEQLASHYGVEL
jgi:hypothetical protein